MKISTWNVNSVNARIEHLETLIKKDQSDIYLLQELKTIEDGFPKEIIEKMGYNSYVKGQKAWNGVAMLSKKQLYITNTSIPKYDDPNARFIEAEIQLKKIKKKIKLINIYLPNGNPIETEKFNYKIEWMKKLNIYIQNLKYSYFFPLSQGVLGTDFGFFFAHPGSGNHLIDEYLLYVSKMFPPFSARGSLVLFK